MCSGACHGTDHLLTGMGRVQHTKQCLCCSGALEGFKKAQTALYVVAGVWTAVGAALAQTPPQRYLAVAIAAVAALLAWHVQAWICMFYFKGWDHARMP